MSKELICIACPLGCHLTVNVRDKEDIDISGNKCKRGVEYAKEELFSPRRTVTATCNIHSSLVSRLPVKTQKPFPKEKITELLQEIYMLKPQVPIHLGDCLIKNALDTGIDVIATYSLKK